MDRHDLYELCVQSPRTIVTFLEKVHGQRPTVLREDFCGTAAVSRRWVSEGAKRGELWRSVAADISGETLARARVLAEAELVRRDIEFATVDCIRAEVKSTDAADVIYVGNFSIGEIHNLMQLSQYFARCHERLALGNLGFGGGVLVFDLYGGPGAFEPSVLHRPHTARTGERIKYTWRHEHADARTRMVENSISFAVHGADGVHTFERAFTYRWRLWAPDELFDALRHAHFNDIQLHTRMALAPTESPCPLRDASELSKDWIAYVVARQI